MNIIEEIIERLKKEHGDKGIYYVLNSWYSDFINFEVGTDTHAQAFRSILGFLYGLEATGYITDSEGDKAREFLLG